MRSLSILAAVSVLVLSGSLSGCRDEATAPQAKAETAAPKADPKAEASKAADAAAVLASLTPEQQAAVRALVRDTLVTNPEIMDDVQAAYETRQRDAQNRQVQQASATLIRDHAGLSVGPANAKITVIQFFDYKCPFCHQSNAWVQTLIDTRKDVRVIFKELPVLSENSTGAARAAIAANKQGKYLVFHNALMTARGDLNPQQVMQIAASVGLDVARLQTDMAAQAVEQSLTGMREQASALGISGTPAFIINGQLVNGWMPERVEAAMASAGSQGAAAGAGPGAGNAGAAAATVTPGR